MIQISSISSELESGTLVNSALRALYLADTMGLLPADDRFEDLGVDAVGRLLRYVHAANVAIHLRFTPDEAVSTEVLEDLVRKLALELQETPVPQFEWKALLSILPLRQAARLMAITDDDVFRFNHEPHGTPDWAAKRLHFLILIISDLSGTYILKCCVATVLSGGALAPPEYSAVPR